jgi:menaquinone-dependent protoporphyrinogen IX oxidase
VWKFHNVLTNHVPSPRKFADKFIRENRKKPTNIIIFRLLGSVADESLNFDVFVRIIKKKIIITEQSTLSRRLDNLKTEV